MSNLLQFLVLNTVFVDRVIMLKLFKIFYLML